MVEKNSTTLAQWKRQHKKKNKFGAKGGYIDGFYFPSQKEGNYYLRLKKMREKGAVLYFHRQEKFDLPGGITYAVDFQAFFPDGHIEYVDVKGVRTAAFIRNKKMVEALYPVEIIEA